MKPLPVFAAALMLAGCTAGRILPPDTQHQGASLITSTADYPISIRPSFGVGRDTVSLARAQGVWVTEGDFLIEECYVVLDGRTTEQHAHVTPGRHYIVGCDKDSRATFTDVGVAPL